MNKYFYYLLTISSIGFILWFQYKNHWLQVNSWLIPTIALIALFVGVLLRQNRDYKNLSWGLIFGILTFFAIVVLRVIWALILASGM